MIAPDAGRPRSLLTVGLTGGIACGKTTVAGILRECGAERIDADSIAHAALEPDGPAHAAVVARFGPGILDARGRIERAVLGREVFADPDELAALERIVHPIVIQEIDRLIGGLAARDVPTIVVVEAALLVETGRWRAFDRLVVVTCRRETQIRRLADRQGLSRRDALLRIEAQAPLEQKLALAHHVIETEGTLEQTRRNTRRVYAALCRALETELD